MNRAWHLFAQLRRIGILLMLLPFVLLALIPSAAMPVLGSDGRFAMVLCTSDGRVQVMFDPATGDLSEMPEKAVASCDWAVATGAMALHDAPVDLARPLVLRSVPPAPVQHAHTPAHDPRGLYARGPPTLT